MKIDHLLTKSRKKARVYNRNLTYLSVLQEVIEELPSSNDKNSTNTEEDTSSGENSGSEEIDDSEYEDAGSGVIEPVFWNKATNLDRTIPADDKKSGPIKVVLNSSGQDLNNTKSSLPNVENGNSKTVFPIKEKEQPILRKHKGYISINGKRKKWSLFVHRSMLDHVLTGRSLVKHGKMTHPIFHNIQTLFTFESVAFKSLNPFSIQYTCLTCPRAL